jgi:hypothetical protein
VVHQVVRRALLILLLHAAVCPDGAHAKHGEVHRDGDVEAESILGGNHGSEGLSLSSELWHNEKKQGL